MEFKISRLFQFQEIGRELNLNYLRILCQEQLRISDSFVQGNTERMVCQLVTRTAVFTGIHDLALTIFTSSCCSEYLVRLKESQECVALI